MSDIIAALRLAKERAVESENDEDLAIFRDAEKQAMSLEHQHERSKALLEDALPRLRALEAVTDTLVGIQRVMDEDSGLEKSPRDEGFDQGVQWAYTEINNAIRRHHGDR